MSQVIPIAIAPILTRLFTPAEFGFFSIYFSFLMIGSVVVTCKYELAIILPTSDREAKAVLDLSIISSIITSLVVLGVLLLLEKSLLDFFRLENFKGKLLWIPLGLVGIGFSQSFYYYFNRSQQYKWMSVIRVSRSILYSFAALLGGVLHVPGALVAADAISYAAPNFLAIRKLKVGLGSFTRKKDLIYVARKYKNFPRYSIVSGLLEKGAGQAPVLLLTNTFQSLVSAGFFSFAQRMIVAPADLVGKAIGDVFRQQASAIYVANGNCKELFKKTFRKLCVIGLPAFIVAFFVVEDIFAFVFGESWREAGFYAKLMMPMFFMQFVVSPVSVMFFIAQKQKADTALQVLLLFLVLNSFLFGYYFKSIERALVFYTISYCLKYMIELGLAYRYSKGE